MRVEVEAVAEVASGGAAYGPGTFRGGTRTATRGCAGGDTQTLGLGGSGGDVVCL